MARGQKELNAELGSVFEVYMIEKILFTNP